MLSPQQSLTEAIALLDHMDQHGLPVIGKHGDLLGVLDMETILSTPEIGRESSTVNEVMKRHALTIFPDETLDNALELLTSNHLQWAPVIEAEPFSPEEHAIGILSVSAIVKHYRSMVTSETQRTQGLVDGENIP
jgi:CBS domain-containing protein